MRYFLFTVMVFSLLLVQNNIAQAGNEDLINEQFFNNGSYVQAYDPYEDISEKYSYNEKEETDKSLKYLKTKYDINMGKESQMSVGIKGFSFKFKY